MNHIVYFLLLYSMTQTNEYYIFNVVGIVFIIIFLYYLIYDGIKYGVLKTLFIWSFTIIGTPIPFAGILLSFPLRLFYDFPMIFTQIMVSIVSILFIIYGRLFHIHIVKHSSFRIGRLFDKIIKSNSYILFIVSILSSVLITQLISNIYTDRYFIPNTENWVLLSIIVLLVLGYFYLLPV
jgi:hypothetical protein